jgi:hypothetical protein
MSLHPCPSCDRHVRASETTCPFCEASIAIVVPAPRMITERLGRAALFTLGAAVVVVSGVELSGCSSVPTYGGPAQDSGSVSDAAVPADTSTANQDSGFFPPYGTPADTGPQPDGGPPEDGGTDGGLAGAYGGPPIDAGH